MLTTVVLLNSKGGGEVGVGVDAGVGLGVDVCVGLGWCRGGVV